MLDVLLGLPERLRHAPVLVVDLVHPLLLVHLALLHLGHLVLERLDKVQVVVRDVVVVVLDVREL